MGKSEKGSEVVLYKKTITTKIKMMKKESNFKRQNAFYMCKIKLFNF